MPVIHKTISHLLPHHPGDSIVLLLSEDDGEHSVRATAGLIHVGGCHSPGHHTHNTNE